MSDLADPHTSHGSTTSASARLFDQLNASGLRYVHFKSNMQLDRALSGETDLDLFVDPADRDAFAETLLAAGFKRAVSHWPLDVPDVDHFFGLDPATGRLLHPHVYYGLLLGGRTAKDYRPPLGPWLLEGTRMLDGVRVPAIETELVLLFLRANLKVDLVALVKAVLKKRPVSSRGELEEFRWLASQADPEETRRRLDASGLSIAHGDVDEFLRRLEGGDLSPTYAMSARRRVRKALRRFRTRDASAGAAARVRMSRAARKIRSLPKKTLPGRAPSIAIVGADGSGKTTLARDLAKWLGWKFDVRHIYFGIPKRSPVVRTLRKARGATARLPGHAADHPGALWRLLDRALWLAVARRRLADHEATRRASASGVVVLAERYPLPALWEMSEPMDGPRIASADQAGYQRERRIYARIGEPDLIVVLATDLGTLRARESRLREDIHAEKVRVVESLRRHPKAHVIDASRPYDEVLLEAKRAVWRAL